MGVVVHHCSALDEVVELGRGVLEEAVVEVALRRLEVQLDDVDDQGRQLEVFFTLLFRAAQHGHVQHFLTQSSHRPGAGAGVAGLLDGLQDFPIEVVVVHHRRVAALLADGSPRAEAPVQRLAVAALLVAIIITKGLHPEEAHEALQFLDAILQGRPREAPPHLRPQREDRFRSARRVALDAMRLVQQDPIPLGAVQQRPPQVDALEVFYQLLRRERPLELVLRGFGVRGRRRGRRRVRVVVGVII
mmetsp:Transcript_25382/g.82098  ORF Transcript_25382/g.82098 Transcript_25382/m.82098 type:complete len:246 (+) Transcript_25382:1760-2497(+)